MMKRTTTILTTFVISCLLGLVCGCSESEVDQLRRLAERGDAHAQNSLGVRYFTGFGVEKNCQEALKWLHKAAEQGNIEAQYRLGFYYKQGVGVERNDAEAVKWYRKAAEQGLTLAQYELGICYYHGEGVEENCEEAVKWYRKAAEKGYKPAQIRVSDVESEIGFGPTDSQQLFLAVLNAVHNGMDWLESQKVAFADLPAEFKVAYDTSAFCDVRGEPLEDPYKPEVICYDMDQDGSAEYIVSNGFCGSSGNGWMIFTQKDKKWEKLDEVNGSLKKVTHPKGRGLLIHTPNGGCYCSFRYYELENGNLVLKLGLDITYAHSEDGGFLREKPVDIKVRYE